MAWYNPATWTFVDNIQGQNKKQPSTPSNWQDPTKAVGSFNGRAYNYAGDWLGPAPGSTTQNNNDNAKYMADLQAQIRALNNQMAQQPKLAKFDVMANWRNAQSAAERAVNPLYEKKLSNFLEQNQAKRVRKQGEFNLTKEQTAQELADTLSTNAINRTRTAEDTQMAVDTINTKESQFQTDEGQSFDANYRQVAEQLAASGAATTGMGKQQTSDMVRLRNVTSQRQLDEFQGQREAKQLFKTRTFEDLARGDEQANRLATSKTKAAQFDLDAYIEDLAFDETNFRMSNEAERMSAVYADAENQRQLGVEQFLAGLAGSGYGAKDIAYNRQVYA
jgi:hypothetical protein